MSSTSTPRLNHAHDVVFHQDRYTLRRRLIRRFLLRGFAFHVLVKIDAEGLEHIPADGPTLLMMNHIAAIDPFVVTGVVTSRFVVPMSKVENYRNPIVGFMARTWGVYPVRRGEVDRKALGSTIELLHQNRPVLIAPEGTRQPALAEAKHGLTYVATKANAAIVPIGLEGTDRFPATLKRLRRTPVSVRIGRAFRFHVGEQDRIPRDDLHAMTQEAMFQLAALLPNHRRGAYSDLSQATTHHLDFIE